MTTRGPYRKVSLADRFWPKVDKSGECWLWQGSTRPEGHGQVHRPGKYGGTAQAHVVAWELLRGRLPEGTILHHLCHTAGCVNPDHLEPTNRVEHPNHHLKTTCKFGHPLHRYPSGRSVCRTCKSRWNREQQQRRRGR